MNRTDHNNSHLYKKLGAYALAIAALFAAPGAAKAEIQYVAVNQTFTSADANRTYSGYATDPGTAAFQITALLEGQIANGNSIFAGSAPGGFLMDGSGGAAALAFGAVIDPTNTANFVVSSILASTDPTDPGAWSTAGGDAYLGLYFLDADGLHSGWVHLATAADNDGSSFEVLGYAYDTNTNAAITAGEGEPTNATPEPSSLALLALGGAGLLAFRRRRSARA